MYTNYPALYPHCGHMTRRLHSCAKVQNWSGKITGSYNIVLTGLYTNSVLFLPTSTRRNVTRHGSDSQELIFKLFYLTTLSPAKVIQRRWWMNEWVWSVGGMVLTGENWSTGRETCYDATLSTTSFTWTDMGLNPKLRAERPATDRQKVGRVIKSYWIATNQNIKWESVKVYKWQLIFFLFSSLGLFKMNKLSLSTDLWTEDTAGTSSWMLYV
jgi:hypothetical protein